MRSEKNIEMSYKIAKEIYAGMGVDTDLCLQQLDKIPISLHCWQGDDVVGFEKDASGASGGILSTGNYPGKARNIQELYQDLDTALKLIPGNNMRVNVHAIYLDSEKPVERNQIQPEHFQSWIDWAKERNLGLDFNPTCFSHPMAADGLTLSHAREDVRQYWIEHVVQCRKISEEFGKQLGKRCFMNIWIPDGFKDIPVDRNAARARLKDSLDKILQVPVDSAYMRDAVESKLFGIGVESCTVGSNEFYLAYAMKNNLMLTLDSGHFHPTEVISDKLSSVLLFLDEVLLHVSRPVRWDSDHVVIFDDELQQIASEIVRIGQERIHIGLDYFDGTINRIAAWTVGTRNMQKALCKALLEPKAELQKIEEQGNYTKRLVLTEELKALPFQAVYDYFCLTHQTPVGFDVMQEIQDYENQVLAKR